MSSMKEIKQRIANVSSTEQIIKAMDIVASTKLQRARAQLEGVRPIYYELKRLVAEVGDQEEAKTHVFYGEREVRNSLYIVLTSDRGFSGGYNAGILTKALAHMNQGKKESILAVGAKGYEYLRKQGKNIIRKIIDLPDTQVYYGTESIAKWVIDLYQSGEVEEVFVAYTHFENVLSYVPSVERVLPVVTNIGTRTESHRKYEPTLATYIDHLIPIYLHMNLFRAFSESHTSEQAARMVSMDAAGKNAEEMIEELTRMYNRKRQAVITQELSEIVGSTNILNKGGRHDS
ncbi:MAG TPA: ATP synthase F1 subunit gamma [Firmicutes bacterium]|nr:ATP synthase F1 subunit gamma [Bacillota bacterium]